MLDTSLGSLGITSFPSLTSCWMGLMGCNTSCLAMNSMVRTLLMATRSGMVLELWL